LPKWDERAVWAVQFSDVHPADDEPTHDNRPEDVTAARRVGERRPTHVLAWFPGDLLCGNAAASHWELYSRAEWQRNADGKWLTSDLPQDSEPADLQALVSAELGRSVVEFRADTWRAALPTQAGEPGQWHTYPAYKIVADDRRQ
jgi:hypothetical protein